VGEDGDRSQGDLALSLTDRSHEGKGSWALYGASKVLATHMAAISAGGRDVSLVRDRHPSRAESGKRPRVRRGWV